MNLDAWVQIAIALGTVVAAVIAVMAIRKDSRKEDRELHEARIRELARSEQDIIKDRLAITDTRIAQLQDSSGRIDSTVTKLSDTVADVRERLTSVETLQRQHIEQITMNLMKFMHQPDPRRNHIDRLFEAFMEGVITQEESIELKKILVAIRNLEPSEDQVNDSIEKLGFPVYPGEQTAAAIILGTMDLVEPSRLASYGHATHRSSAHNDTREE